MRPYIQKKPIRPSTPILTKIVKVQTVYGPRARPIKAQHLLIEIEQHKRFALTVTQERMFCARFQRYGIGKDTPHHVHVFLVLYERARSFKNLCADRSSRKSLKGKYDADKKGE